MLNKIGKKLGYDDDGFTIIEVLIVLAIAGLILVVVLIAVPQLQRNQRNNARQSLLARISTEVGNYSGNNNGTIPAAAAGNNAGNFGDTTADTNAFMGRYLSDVDIQDPSTGADVEVIFGTPANAPAEFQVKYTVASECGLDGSINTLSGENRTYTLRYGLEGGSTYCLDNK